MGRKESNQTNITFGVVKGCKQPPKTRDLLCVGAFLEGWHIMFLPTMETYGRMCDDTFD